MKVTGQNVNKTVGNLDSGKVDKAGLKKEGPGALGKDVQAKNAEASAKINVSERAQAMQKAKDIASDPSIDEAKVARLQKMIDEGKYKVDASSVADRLVDEHLMFPE